MTFKGAFKHLALGNRIKRANWQDDMYVFAHNPRGETISKMQIYLVADCSLVAIKDEEIASWLAQPKRLIHDWIVLKK